MISIRLETKTEPTTEKNLVQGRENTEDEDIDIYLH